MAMTATLVFGKKSENAITCEFNEDMMVNCNALVNLEERESCGTEEEEVSFCNYDLGDTGFIEYCEDFEEDWMCYWSGLPDDGADDCYDMCFVQEHCGTE